MTGARTTPFATLALFAALDRRLVDRRLRRAPGPEWEAQRAMVKLAPLWARPHAWDQLVVYQALSLALYAGLLHLHSLTLGVDP